MSLAPPGCSEELQTLVLEVEGLTYAIWKLKATDGHCSGPWMSTCLVRGLYQTMSD